MIELGQSKPDEGGFTLMEMLVALVLFALISMAGVTLVDTVLGVQQRIEGRSDRLAEIQRVAFIVTADMEQLVDGPVYNAAGVRFARASAAGNYPVAYRFADGILYRASGETEYTLLAGVGAVSWRFLHDGTWSDQAMIRPVAEPVQAGISEPSVAGAAPVGSAAPASRPRAVELKVTLAENVRGPRGSLRRVIELPPAP